MKKTLSFAALHFAVAFSVTWALTGDMLVGGAVALIEPAINSVVYHWHEKYWNSKQSLPGTESSSLAA